MTGQTYRAAIQSIALEQAAGDDVQARIEALAQATGLSIASIEVDVTEIADLLADA